MNHESYKNGINIKSEHRHRQPWWKKSAGAGSALFYIIIQNRKKTKSATKMQATTGKHWLEQYQLVKR